MKSHQEPQSRRETSVPGDRVEPWGGERGGPGSDLLEQGSVDKPDNLEGTEGGDLRCAGSKQGRLPVVDQDHHAEDHGGGGDTDSQPQERGERSPPLLGAHLAGRVSGDLHERWNGGHDLSLCTGLQNGERYYLGVFIMMLTSSIPMLLLKSTTS